MFYNFKKINIPAIISGLTIDLILSLLAGVVYALVILFNRSNGNISVLLNDYKFTEKIIYTYPYYVHIYVLSSFCSIVGGYVTSKIAKHNIYLNLFIYCIISLAISILIINTGIKNNLQILLYIISAFSPIFGGLIWKIFSKTKL